MLDKPLKIRSTTLHNRFALAPLTNTQSNPDGTLADDELQWLQHRAGHFGIVSTCAAYISQEGKAWNGQLGIAEEKHMHGLTKIAEAIRRKGSAAFIQLHHAGAKAELAPTKITSSAVDDAKAATQTDLKRIRDDFVEAAKRAHKAGFDGVEIHGANGYIFTQFLSPVLNQRKDEYGGSIENRARFLRETLKAVRQAVPIIVAVRISPVDTFSKLGLTIEDSCKVAKWLTEDGADIIHLSLRNASAPQANDQIPVVRRIKDSVGETLVAAAGGIWTRKDAEEANQSGADLVVLGKSAIVHPDWPTASLKSNFQPMLPPWDPKHLTEVKVGDKFLKYLLRFPGLVEGGAPPRT